MDVLRIIKCFATETNAIAIKYVRVTRLINELRFEICQVFTIILYFSFVYCLPPMTIVKTIIHRFP